MTRAEGFSVADVNASLLADPKIKALWRTLKDPVRMMAALVVHEATLLASWLAGERVLAQDAAPDWLPTETVEQAIQDLCSHRLLDRTQRIPRRSWRAWFEPARTRRDAYRDRWMRANQKRKEKAETTTARLPRGYRAVTATDRPTVRPSDRPTAPARDAPARGGSNGVKDPKDDRAQAIARAQARIDDPSTSDDVKRAARFSLEKLGAPAP